MTMTDAKVTKGDLVKISAATYEIPKTYNPSMRVPAQVFANEAMIDSILTDRSLWQLTNVASLPGIQKAALAMPDIHEGYGFPIGGVAAMAIHEGGVISPGGIGYDINCGVRLLRLTMQYEEIKPYLNELADELFRTIPSGVGKGGALSVNDKELNTILDRGAQRMVELGYGEQSDADYCEEGGCIEAADSTYVSERARSRGRDQLGTLGSGNHFLEVQRIDEIFEPEIAQAFGLQKGHVTVMIHCGSRGLGHQTCTDYVGMMLKRLDDWKIQLPDPELACAPFTSSEGQKYFKAMSAAANFAWANRHLIGHWTRQAVTKVLGPMAKVSTVYDICHNVGKIEKHHIDGSMKEVIMHRKGATRAFPAHHPALTGPYAAVGHPVLVPGTMGTSSYVLVGTEKGLVDAFGSSCHGAGRRMSRAQAKRTVRGSELREELLHQGIIIKSKSDPGLAEEAPSAYKDVEMVIDVIKQAGIAKPVARMRPIAVIKGD